MQEQNYEETTKSFYELLRSIQRSYVKDTTKDRTPDFYQAPDFSSLSDRKDRLERNHEDTLRSVQMEWIPKVKRAQEILNSLRDGKPIENVTEASPSEDETKPVEPEEHLEEKKSEGDKADEKPAGSEDSEKNKKENKDGNDQETPEENGSELSVPTAKALKTVPLWAFLLMSGAFIVTAIALILTLI